MKKIDIQINQAKILSVEGVGEIIKVIKESEANIIKAMKTCKLLAEARVEKLNPYKKAKSENRAKEIDTYQTINS